MGVDDLSSTSVLVDRVMHLYQREILRVHREDTLVAVSRRVRAQANGDRHGGR